MSEHVVKLLLNCIRAPECIVAFEPEGATVTLREGSPITVEISGRGDGIVEVSYWPDGISVDAWSGADTDAWDSNGNKLAI
jgi:hypothetical protein